MEGKGGVSAIVCLKCSQPGIQQQLRQTEKKGTLEIKVVGQRSGVCLSLRAWDEVSLAVINYITVVQNTTHKT